MELNDITGEVVRSAMKVHTALGPGLLESAYTRCLEYELTKRGCKVEREVPIPISYDGLKLDVGYRLDLLVEDAVVVEVKALVKVPPVYEAQLLSHLRLGRFKVGLLINFHVRSLKHGIKRMVN